MDPWIHLKSWTAGRHQQHEHRSPEPPGGGAPSAGLSGGSVGHPRINTSEGVSAGANSPHLDRRSQHPASPRLLAVELLRGLIGCCGIVVDEGSGLSHRELTAQSNGLFGTGAKPMWPAIWGALVGHSPVDADSRDDSELETPPPGAYSQSVSAHELLEAALELPASERAALTERLARSLEPDGGVGPAAWHRAWSTELDARLNAIDAGKTELIDDAAVWAEVDSLFADPPK